MNVEITRGRSDIYDILTHLTFILLNHINTKSVLLDDAGEVSRDWMKLPSFLTAKKLTLVEKRKRFHMLRISLEGL
jgi:hypothetical protein